MALLLGEDGRGYELARRLEGCGAWRSWLGDAAYPAFAHALASPAAWEAFMTSRSQIPLQLRARALLYDKASAALFLRPSSSSSSSSAASPSLSDIDPNFLQLHGDDIYFSLEDLQDGARHQTQPAFSPCKANEHSYERASSVGLRYNELENANTSQRHRHDEFPETWSSQCVEKYRLRHHKYRYGDKETNKRTPEGMSAYLKLREIHKRKRQVFKEEHMLVNGSSMHSRVVSETNNSTEEDSLFFPEIMFPSNCVPDSALPPTNGLEENQKVEVFGVLDNLPTLMSTSPAMIERFGIRPEEVKIGTKYRGKDGSGVNRKSLSPEQATQMTHKIVARLLVNLGFEGGSEASMEVLSEFISSHICKLGRILKLLTDSYRKQFSSIEVLKMFLQTTEHGNLGALVEITKNVNRGFTQQIPQHVRTLQSQNQNPLLQAQQFQRQVRPQMNVLHPQNLTIQQQQQLLRRRQATTPRGSQMVMDKDQPMVEVKLENMMESSMEGSFSTLNKHPVQMRHQQMAMANQHIQSGQMAMANQHIQSGQMAMANQHPQSGQMAMANQHPQSGQMAMTNQHTQSGQQFKQLPHIQIPQLQAQSAYGMRTPQVKVETFQELVAGDSTLKHEPEHNKLTSLPK